MNTLAWFAPTQHATPITVRGLSPMALLAVLGLHGLALLVFMHHQAVQVRPEEPPVVMVSLQREVQPAQPEAQAKPEPVRPRQEAKPRQSEPVPDRAAKAMPQSTPKPAPVPLLAAQATPTTAAELARMVEAAPTLKAPAEPVVQAQARQAEAAPAPVAKALPQAVVAPRFDADYLDNPSPTYPPLSRREGEEGTVMLSVYVEANGQAGKVELARGSGFERLDRAAMAAVKRWRFVPARRGSEAVADWVRVPIVFSLKE